MVKNPYAIEKKEREAKQAAKRKKEEEEKEKEQQRKRRRTESSTSSVAAAAAPSNANESSSDDDAASSQPSPFKNVFERMIKSQRKKDADRKRKGARPFTSSGTRKKAAADDTDKKRKGKGKRKQKQGSKKKDDAGDSTRKKKKRKKKKGATPDFDDCSPGWHPSTAQFLEGCLTDMKGETYFEERGTHELKGEWPSWAIGRYQPSLDPLCNEIAPNELTREHFALPDVLMWGPELQYPHLYPKGRPNCPWHRDWRCVEHLGWSNYARRGYDERVNTAICSRNYRCTTREKNEEHPYCFQSHAPGVLEQAPAYVQGAWKEIGFRLSHRGALRWTLVDRMRSVIANGGGAAGFHRSLVEAYKINHANRRKMWRSITEYQYHNRPATVAHVSFSRSCYFDFDDPRNDTEVPSLSYLLKVAVEDIESRIPFYNRKLQMIGGLSLSADHSHKVTKVILIASERGFIGLYTVMNEFGKVLAFWLVMTTSLHEVEENLRGLEERYRQHGFPGPEKITVDRCCTESGFWAGSKNKAEKPIFSTLARVAITADAVGDVAVSDDVVEGDAAHAATMEAEGVEPTGTVNGGETQATGVRVVREVSLPSEPVQPTTSSLADMTAGEIATKLIELSENGMPKALALDCEFTPKSMRTPDTPVGPHVLQITLVDQSTYVFPIKDYGSFPTGLKRLLETDDVIKVGSCIDVEVRKCREVGVELRNTVEVGHLAKERGVSATRRPSLAYLVKNLFDCTLAKDNTIRLSDWGAPGELSGEQIRYAALDAYATMAVYQKLTSMPCTDAKTLPIPNTADLLPGTRVFLFNKRRNAVVAEATIQSELPENATERVLRRGAIDVQVMKSDVRAPSALLPFSDDAQKEQSLGSLFSENGDENETIEIRWKLNSVRVIPDEVERPFSNVSVAFKEIVEPISTDDNDGDDPNIDAVDAAAEAATAGEPSSDGEDDDDIDAFIDDLVAERNRVKLDIEHMFIRHQKVLKTEHGAYKPFMARLSDAFFVPSQDDIELIKLALQKRGYSEDKIRQKTWPFYKKRVRRSVPAPTELLKNYKRVVAMFANIRDAKTGEPLFRKKAWVLYKHTCKHIRKGCLSDIPGMAYYYQIDEDSNGIPIFKCIRGTSALEGFHQKIRQLIRGFNISPRFAIASLHEFVYRWNHDIDCRILGLPRQYTNYYDGFEIEEEIDVTASWDEMLTPAHAEWFASTRDYAPVAAEVPSGLAASANSIPLGDLDDEVAKVVDAILDGTFDVADEGDDKVTVHEFEKLPESAAWLGRILCTKRAFGPIRTAAEIKFFRDHVMHFQIQPGSERDADNYSSIDWTRFALCFNEVIQAEEDGKRPKSDMTLKTAYHLSSYWKEYKKERNADLTMLGMVDANNTLRRELRGPHRETTGQIPEVPAIDVRPETQTHASNNMAHEIDSDNERQIGKQGTEHVQVARFGAIPAGADLSDYQSMRPHKQEQETKKCNRRRCRVCGHEIKSRPDDHLPGFPLAEGEDFPRRHRDRSKKGKDNKKSNEP